MKKITKISKITNFAVFQNFEWDKNVKDKAGIVQEFKDINIFYGRNYSGKTTLSRIFRSFETGIISDKYENPQFEITLEDNTKRTQSDIKDRQNFRVFNSDFIDENLSFIHDENGTVKPFAITLGGDNNVLLDEIKAIKEVLGNNTDGEKSGLYKDIESNTKSYQNAQKAYDDKRNFIEDSIISKASDMKRNLRSFVDVSYNKNSLKNDIENVIKSSFTTKTEKEITVLQKTLEEKEKSEIREVSCNFSFDILVANVKKQLSKTVESADKITELVEDALLNNWVKQGLSLHENRTTCAFCGQILPQNRLSVLQHHFNEEMNNFQSELDSVMVKIDKEKKSVETFCINLNKDIFYATYQNDAKKIIDEIKVNCIKYTEQLEKLSKQIEDKKKDVFHVLPFSDVTNFTDVVERKISEFNELIKKSNSFGKNLKTEKIHAKDTLRLNVVKQYIDDSKYIQQTTEQTTLEENAQTKKNDLDTVQELINTKEKELTDKEANLNDEKEGAKKVNEYLSNYFGNEFLRLEPIEKQSEEEDSKQYVFEIQRDGKKAFNLSEGECRLVAFAYFMAKLNDVDTKDKKPLIWIDDPICSLDANHVFFVYSLIYSEIVKKDIFTQLFISTHNLDFFKYLKELSKSSKKDKDKQYFIIERFNEISTLRSMPDYLKSYVTEFNYLFNEIYKCSKIDNPSDENYPSVYNFGNNARKFLEIYLFYKFPDDSGKPQKFAKFFGGESCIPKFINDRITNEYSHLEQGGVERATTPIEVPEFKKDAQKILDCIKRNDEEQYNALLNSIGVKVATSEAVST